MVKTSYCGSNRLGPTRRRSRPSLRLGVKAPRVFDGVYCILNLHKHSRLGGSAPGRWAHFRNRCNRRMPAAVLCLKVNIHFFEQISNKLKYLVYWREMVGDCSLARQVWEEKVRVGESKKRVIGRRHR
jgi:hypothetical protein